MMLGFFSCYAKPIVRLAPFMTRRRVSRNSRTFLAVPLFVLCTVGVDREQAWAVRPFVTDDARITYPGQLETESWIELGTARGQRPEWGLHVLTGTTVSDRLELIAGWTGVSYQDRRIHLDDLVVQPKYLLYRSFGGVPSVSAALGMLVPISGDRQRWNSYAMVHVSWFLDIPEDSTDPYDNGLAIHINLGSKSQYHAGLSGRYTTKPYWGVGFEVKTPISREFRFLGEVFNADPFDFEGEFPAFQTGFRWYKSPNVQWDVAYGGFRSPPREEHRLWNHTFQTGLRVLFEDVFPFR